MAVQSQTKSSKFGSRTVTLTMSLKRVYDSNGTKKAVFSYDMSLSSDGSASYGTIFPGTSAPRSTLRKDSSSGTTIVTASGVSDSKSGEVSVDVSASGGTVNFFVDARVTETAGYDIYSGWIIRSYSTSLSMNFTVPAYVNPVTLSYSSTVIQTNGSITVTVSGWNSLFSGLKFTLGGVDLGTVRSNGSYTYQYPQRLLEDFSSTSTVKTSTLYGTLTAYELGTTSVQYTYATYSQIVTAVLETKYVPEFTYTLEDTDSSIVPMYGAHVQNISRINVETEASSVLNAGIASITVTVQGNTYYGKSIVTNVLLEYGTSEVTITVVDTRGRSTTKKLNITVIEYSPPTASLTVERTDSAGVKDEQGAYAKVTASAVVYSVNNKNSASIILEYAKTTETQWSTLQNSTVYRYTYSQVISADTFSSYNFRIIVVDNFLSANMYAFISSTFTLMNFDTRKNGVAFGKMVENESLIDFGLPVRFMDEVSFYNGASGSVDDSGWVACTSLEPRFQPYENKEENIPKYRLYGSIVEIRGSIIPIEEIAGSDTEITLFTLPPIYRPCTTVYKVCQGNAKNTWLMAINTDGTVTFSRYGAVMNITAGLTSRLMLDAVYLVD